jgi:uncharacterized membrane protein YphA (DoxX/SURF4 family)
MNRTLRILHWLSRLALAVVFIWSGWVKFLEPLQFAVAITGYKVVPDQYAFPIARYFPWLEIALGLVILIGFKIRWSSVAAALLMLFFIVLLSITLSRGIDTNCGCFGFGDKITWKTIARDGSFLIPALFLVYETRRRKEPKISETADNPS